MKIKTSEEIRKPSNVTIKTGMTIFSYNEPNKKRWVAVDDMAKLIRYARNNCRGEPDKLEKILLDTLEKN